MTANGTSDLSQDVLNDPDHLYTLLNLPRTATENEIKEKHRSLSLIFHPDKQRDERTRETASRRFLEIQKAYEVLSDPFTRTVYDIFGYAGLRRQWPKEWRSRPQEELKQLLSLVNTNLLRDEFDQQLRPRGTLRVILDGRPLARRSNPGRGRFVDLKDRLDECSIMNFSLRESRQIRVNDKLRVEAAGVATGRGTLSIMGTARYQYSPKISMTTSTSLLRLLYGPNFNTTLEYDGEELGYISAQTTIRYPLPALPPCVVTFRRQLFKDSLTQGEMRLTVGPKPSLALDFITPTLVDLGDSRTEPEPDRAVLVGRFGLTLAGLATALRAGFGVSLPKLSTEVKLDLQFGPLSGPGAALTGSWGDKVNGVTSTVSVGAQGVALVLDMCYRGQRLAVPVALADDFDPSVAAFSAALPAAASTLVYHFIVKPRRRKERRQFYRAARKAFEDDQQNSARREVENTVALLKDTARKHMQVEKAVQGLVILEAVYGPTDPAPEAKALMTDVTTALQALVYKSQLYIPPHRRKAGIPGFYDPAPSCPESLRIRYLFDDRPHYAEISDDRPCVLPLREHLVDGVQ